MGLLWCDMLVLVVALNEVLIGSATSLALLWSSFFVTLVAKKNSAYQFMLPSLLHMGFDNHYNCVDEHDYNQRMQILLPFDRVFPLL